MATKGSYGSGDRTLQPGNCGNRSATARGESRHRRVVPGALGLVGRIADPPSRGTPPGSNPAPRFERRGCGSRFDGITSLPVFALGGNNGQAHLLTDGAGQEAADGMRLPSAGLLKLLRCCAARPLQQVQDFGGFAAVAGAGGFLRAFGRFLGRGGLLPRLGLFRRNGRDTCASAGLFRGFRLGNRAGRMPFQSVLYSRSCFLLAR